MPPLQVLLVTGGHPYDEAAFRAMFATFTTMTVTEVQHPQAAAWYDPATLARFDAFIFYDFGQTRETAPPAAIETAIAQGKGAVFLHHALCNYPDWPAYPALVGGFWQDRVFTIEGQAYGPSQAVVTPQLPVQIMPHEHPVTAGITDFFLDDEYYTAYYVAPEMTPLLTTTIAETTLLIGWTHRYGTGQVAYLQPGHGPATYAHPQYRQLVAQAIQFVSTPLAALEEAASS